MAIDTQLGIKIILILGITNVATILLVPTSCRYMGLRKITNRFFQYSWH